MLLKAVMESPRFHDFIQQAGQASARAPYSAVIPALLEKAGQIYDLNCTLIPSGLVMFCHPEVNGFLFVELQGRSGCYKATMDLNRHVAPADVITGGPGYTMYLHKEQEFVYDGDRATC